MKITLKFLVLFFLSNYGMFAQNSFSLKENNVAVQQNSGIVDRENRQVFDLNEDVPVLQNGIAYGFTIRNERSKEIKDNEYERYEITVYATNKTACHQFYLKNDSFSMLGNSYTPNTIAIYDCLNATGKRLTSKGGTVHANPFYVPYSQTNKGADGKSITSSTRVQGGYLFRNGESVSANFIVIVPQGERPKMKCRLISISDF